MGYEPPIKWGGRVGRYRDTPRAARRCLDPITRTAVVFETAFEHEAWLRARFGLLTRTISGAKSIVRATTSSGVVVEALTSFEVIDIYGRTTYHLVAPSPDSARAKALRRVASLRGTSVRIETCGELRSEPNIRAYWRMELMRQASLVEDGGSADVEAQILCAISAEPMPFRQIHALLGQVSAQVLRASLTRLHCAHDLRIDFSCDALNVTGRSGK